jgi:two-component system, OmpR family, sensor kinase
MRRQPVRGPSVRTKVVGTVLVLAASGMAVAETAAYTVQSARLEQRLDAAVLQEVAEFRTLAEQGVDPDTGDRFGSVEQLMRTALARNVADDSETFLALVDGEPAFTPLGPRVVALEDEPAVLAAARDAQGSEVVRVVDVPSSVGRLRLAAVPVTVEGAPSRGTYVVAYAVDRERRLLVDIARTYALVALLSLLVLAGVAWAVTGRLLRPLRLLREEAQRTAATELAGRLPVRGNDDVSELTRSFNGMLDRLGASFEEQRQFLDDAGHELRTPVTIVRGHLELLDPSDPVETAETRDLLLDEVDRMSRLVEDLVLLAKARRPDFVRPCAVDVGRLTDAVLDKARPLGDRDWRLDARGQGVVHADGQRLTQALLQLADNAVKHTPPGTEVAVGSSVQDGQVRLWVRDTGPGIDPADHARVFERFGRTEEGRGTEGSGLGLAIVQAIASAHGGRVELASAPGRGATFTLVVPRGRSST